MFKQIHVFRVKPKQELLNEVTGYCREHGITSGIIIGIIGSVEKAQLNFLVELPGKYDSVDYTGPLEIVCAQGSVALHNETPITHIHIHTPQRSERRELAVQLYVSAYPTPFTDIKYWYTTNGRHTEVSAFSFPPSIKIRIGINMGVVEEREDCQEKIKQIHLPFRLSSSSA